MARTTGTAQPGDGHALAPYRPWQLFTRSLLHLHLTDPGGAPRTWSVDVRHGGDDGEVRARLYLDGRDPATATLQVAASGYGLRRIHHVPPRRHSPPSAVLTRRVRVIGVPRSAVDHRARRVVGVGPRCQHRGA